MKLKQWMKKNRHCGRTFAEASMLSKDYVCKIAAEKKIPTFKTALAICKATDYEVALSDIYTEDQLIEIQMKYPEIDIEKARF